VLPWSPKYSICLNGNDDHHAELQSFVSFIHQDVNHAPPNCKDEFKAWSGDYRSKMTGCSLLIDACNF